MSEPTEALVLDLVEWVAASPRTYGEVMSAWRTSCPRLTVWENAVDQGLVMRAHVEGRGSIVTVTPKGLAHLHKNGRIPKSTATAA